MKINSDLFAAFLKCPMKCYLLLTGQSGSGNAYAEWVHQQNDAYRKEAGKQLVAAAEFGAAVTAPDTTKLKTAIWTLALDLNAEAACLESWLHAVERVPSQGPGRPAQFMPIRFTMFNKLTKDDRLLLAFDALVLSEKLGRKVDVGKIIHGDDQGTLKVNVTPLLSTVKALTGNISAMLADASPPDLILNRHCSECEFRESCRQVAQAKDDLSLLGGMSEKERKNYRSKGIFTVTQLSYTFRPRRRPKRLRDKREKYHHSLKALAIREKKIHLIGGGCDLKIDGTPVYLDVEGLPDRDFYCLIGVRVRDGESVAQHSFWADNAEDERRIWTDFVLTLRTIQKPVLIHYGSFETVFLATMTKRYATPSECPPIKDFVSTLNVLSAIYGRIYFPTYSNGLKELAGWLGFEWAELGASGLQAIQWRHSWEISRDGALRERLINYNSQDCEALETVTKALFAFGRASEATATSAPVDPSVVQVASTEPYYTWWKRFKSPIPGLNEINKAAHWDYQRDRVYARSSRSIKRAVKVNRSPTPSKMQPTKVIVLPERQHCPSCGRKGMRRLRGQLRTLFDLEFGRGWIRRKFVEILFRSYWCPSCKSPYGSPTEFWPKSKYGRNLVSYVIYQLIELCIPMNVVCSAMNRLLGMALTQPVVHNFKKSAAARYEDTSQLILDTLLNGKLLHVDETRVSIKGKVGYVWVFANLEGVAYFYSDGREADFVHDLLRDFKGVLVSDFYGAYDSLDCPQQKCLIHLIRDLNDAVLDQPFDEALKEMVSDFAVLLQSIIQTVDRRGLKRHFLRKHLPNVRAFFRQLDERQSPTEAAEKCRQRFLKNRDKLFTFLSYDGVPWNNNNAEHAIRAFANLRDHVRGSWTSKAVKQYLVLLSVCQTCTYMGVDFLNFLRSGEKDVQAFAAMRGRVRKRQDKGTREAASSPS